ncbi:MAG: cysteine methyltransferase, partial [Ilumatobacteraceae bacterium]|nr:cysteine methyltransferase [Ilumatobacteraceae bacterium]
MNECARVVASPIGGICLVANAAGLTHVEFFERHESVAAGTGDAGAEAHLDDAAMQLEEYFAGERRVFDVALDPVG